MQSETLGRATARTPYMEQPRFGPSGAGAPLHAGSAGSPEQAGKPPGRWAATWAASKRGHVGQDPWIQLGAGARLGVLRCAQRRQQQMCPVSPCTRVASIGFSMHTTHLVGVVTRERGS